MTSYCSILNPNIPKSGKKVEDFIALCMISVILSPKSKNYSFPSKYQKVTLRIFLFFSFFQHIFMAALYGEGDVGEMGFSEMG